jgi:predicted NAD-dependent protein-ADP-ribosyltransferase YbiA (DUF1768 family)
MRAHLPRLNRGGRLVNTVDVMELCVRAKFTRHTDLGAQLVATGDALLEEGNTWGDRLWGFCEGQGEYRLGKILMKGRSELRMTAP